MGKYPEDQNFYVALKATKMKEPPIPSVKLDCSECGDEVWVDKKVERLWSTLPVLCLNCALEIMDAKRDTFAVAPETIDSVMEYLLKHKENVKL